MMRRAGRLVWAWLPVLLWASLILWLSSRSDLPVRTNPQTGETIRTTFTVAKVGHVVEYSVLALLLLRALLLPAGGVRLTYLPAAVVTIVAAGILGGIDELRQSMTPNREPRLTDIAIDTVSALVACLAVAAWRRLRGRLAPSACRRSDPLPRLSVSERGTAGEFVSDRGLDGDVSAKAQRSRS